MFRDEGYGESDDGSYIVKFSLILGFKGWMDIPSFLKNINKYLNSVINRFRREYEWEIRHYMFWSDLDEEETFADELIFDNLELFSDSGIMFLRPRVYSVEILRRWYDVWTRPPILCPRYKSGQRYGGQYYLLIPPIYSVIEDGKYRVSIRNEFSNFEYYIYSSGDRDYIALPWHCQEPDFLELILNINKLNNLDEYSKYSRNKEDIIILNNVRGSTIIRAGLSFLSILADIITFSGLFR